MFVAGAVAVGGWWWLERTTRPTHIATPVPGIIAPPATPVSKPTFVAPPPAPAKAPAARDSDPSADGLLAPAPAAEGFANPTPMTAGDILAQPDDDLVRVAKRMTALVLDPHAPKEDREEALAHALNLSAGAETEVLLPLMASPLLSDEMSGTVLAEALNRPLAFQADLYLVALAARKSPGMQRIIREHLTFLTDGRDLGPNPASWTAAIAQAKKTWDE